MAGTMQLFKSPREAELLKLMRTDEVGAQLLHRVVSAIGQGRGLFRDELRVLRDWLVEHSVDIELEELEMIVAPPTKQELQKQRMDQVEALLKRDYEAHINLTVRFSRGEVAVVVNGDDFLLLREWLHQQEGMVGFERRHVPWERSIDDGGRPQVSGVEIHGIRYSLGLNKNEQSYLVRLLDGRPVQVSLWRTA